MVPQQSFFGNPALLASFSATMLKASFSATMHDGKGMEWIVVAASQKKKGMEVFVFSIVTVLNNSINILE